MNHVIYTWNHLRNRWCYSVAHAVRGYLPWRSYKPPRLLQAVHLSGYSVRLPRNAKAVSAASTTGYVYRVMRLRRTSTGVHASAPSLFDGFRSIGRCRVEYRSHNGCACNGGFLPSGVFPRYSRFPVDWITYPSSVSVDWSSSCR